MQEQPKGSTEPILIVEDSEDIRFLLRKRLEQRGHTVLEAHDGLEALEILEREDVALVLLDIMMPRLDGFQVLERLKANPKWRDIPVIVLSAISDMESVVKGIRMGADDYLTKPFKAALLYARVDTLLERKRAHDRKQAALDALKRKQAETERLLQSVLPSDVAERLKRGMLSPGLIEHVEAVTVLFADVVGFTAQAASMPAEEVPQFLSRVFKHFEELTVACEAEPIKTVGDAFMAVVGLTRPVPDHALRGVKLALALREAAGQMRWPDGASVQVRVGLSSGPIAAGVLGTTRLSYDVWGDTVNTASRMQELARPDTILISESTWNLVRDHVICRAQERKVKGKGRMCVYEVVGLRAQRDSSALLCAGKDK